MNAYKLQIASLLFVACAACGPQEKSISKDDARALPLSEWEDDYCAAEGWYNDSVCDAFCPETDAADCAVDDGGECSCDFLPAIAMDCGDGTYVGATCGRVDDGTCGAVFECPDEVDPDECVCEALPAIAMECGDGTYVGATCGRVDSGECGAVFECPDVVEPDECVCDVLPAIAQECPDGSHVGASCGRVESGECGAVFICE